MIQGKKRCLVTGGAGFIGSHLVEKLVSLGHQVTVVDNLARGKKEYTLPKEITFYKGSVTNKSFMNRIVPEQDVVFHLAAMLGVKTTMTHTIEMIHNNFVGTSNILKAASKSGVKVIYASTSEVYGKGVPPFSETMDLTFGPTPKIRWSYAMEKALGESLCLSYGLKGLPVTIARYFNIYGSRQKEGPYGGVIPRFIRAALTGNDIPVYGDGTQTRSFTHVSDAVEATVQCMLPEANQQVFNIGCHHESTIEELARIIKQMTNSPSPIIHVPFEEVYPPEFEEIPKRIPDITKSEIILQYTPQMSFEEGLMESIDWYKSRIKDDDNGKRK